MRLAVDLERALAGEARCSPQERHASRFEPRELNRVVEVVNHLVAAAQYRFDVELSRGRLGGAGDAPRLLECLFGAQQRLRRHATVVGALAPDETQLDDRDGEAVLGESAGAHLAGRAGADHDRVELRHQSGSCGALT